MMAGSSGGKMIVNAGQWPCGFCRKEYRSGFRCRRYSQHLLDYIISDAELFNSAGVFRNESKSHLDH